jgi:hypothetical protein
MKPYINFYLDVGIKKISYHAQDGKVTVFTEKEIDGKDFIVQEFLEQTGLTLLINTVLKENPEVKRAYLGG